ETSAGRDRYRRTRVGRAVGLVGAIFRRFSREGRPLLVLAFLSTMFALDVRRSQLYVAWGALVGLLAASFVASFFYRLRTVRARALVARRVARGAPVNLTV